MADVKPLTRKQRVFVAEYLKCWNATEAARRAGYSERSAYAQGSRLLRNDEVKEAIHARLDEVHMSSDEALKLMSDIARGDMGEVVDDNGLLDLRMARAKGMTKLLRKIKQKTITRIGKTDNDDDVEITEIEFEMYSAKDAQETILKVHGKFKDESEPVRIIVEYADNKNNASSVASSATQNQG